MKVNEFAERQHQFFLNQKVIKFSGRYLSFSFIKNEFLWTSSTIDRIYPLLNYNKYEYIYMYLLLHNCCNHLHKENWFLQQNVLLKHRINGHVISNIWTVMFPFIIQQNW